MKKYRPLLKESIEFIVDYIGDLSNPDDADLSKKAIDNITSNNLKKSGYLYRGISEEEYKYIKLKKGILSNKSDSFESEGTNFAERFDDALSYAYYGRSDPRKTGKTVFIIEIKNNGVAQKQKGRDYWTAKNLIPESLITRIWKIYAKDKKSLYAKEL